ncbi:helix-turn-helix domain-containing protein [Shewanella psychropiezotolerans]|uniref:Helix-turn-helix domain-containing protein n=1 Tax=Shewanella psychropiezotolerans TaxID=2593655 RepID=A0ABX5X0F2_9GAMM|nr:MULTISPECIES: helix-turn-helix domain-containing protein [Shewanella]MPY21558.1 helix-turn-helix domain-containing protein [Shewanella sp. YLB-07]QDO84836.1 helix-turn-helix domain-containing protein [Shewanella psychropiezotolerans]
MNNIFTKTHSNSIPITNHYIDHGNLETPTCQSFGGCLGCQIHTLSGYGGCTSYQASSEEKNVVLRLLIVVKGNNIRWSKGTDEPLLLQKGKSVLIFSANTFNDVFISEVESYVEITDIRFDCQYLMSIYQQMSEKFEDNGINPRTENRPFVFDTSIETQQFINQLKSESADKASDATGNLFVVSQAYQCLSKLLNQLEMIMTNKKHDKYSCLSNHTLNKIRKAHGLITSTPGEDWSIKQLCNAVGTNETSFKRGFKLLFNNTFSKILQQIRMEVAAKELESTEHPIIDIVFNVGYSSPSHFTKLFKQHFGQPPFQYRKNRHLS